MADTETIIKKYIVHEIMNEREESLLKNNDSLLEKGIIDSIGFTKLVAFLEEKFNISVSVEELIPENFETIQSISNLVSRIAKSS